MESQRIIFKVCSKSNEKLLNFRYQSFGGWLWATDKVKITGPVHCKTESCLIFNVEKQYHDFVKRIVHQSKDEFVAQDLTCGEYDSILNQLKQNSIKENENDFRRMNYLRFIQNQNN